MTYLIAIAVLLAAAVVALLWRRRAREQRERIQTERRAQRQSARVKEWASIDRRFPRGDKAATRGDEDGD